MLADGLQERGNFTGFGHQEQDRVRIESSIASFTGKTVDCIRGQAGPGNGCADLAASFRRGFTQSTRKRSGTVWMQIIKGPGGSVPYFNHRIVKRLCDQVKCFFASEIRQISKRGCALGGRVTIQPLHDQGRYRFVWLGFEHRREVRKVLYFDRLSDERLEGLQLCCTVTPFFGNAV